jgi:hypothetical protein
MAPAERLAAAFATMVRGYTFESTVSVGGRTATHASGRWLDGASEFVIEASGSSVTYRTIPPHAWVLKPGGWVAVSGAVPGGDPLDALARPTATTVDAQTPEGLRLPGPYPAAALGLLGTDPVNVSLLIRPDGTLAATYSADLQSGVATSEVVIKPAPSQDPIIPPSLAPTPS